MSKGQSVGGVLWDMVQAVLLAALKFIGFIVAWCLKLLSALLTKLSDELFKLAKK